MTKSEKLELLEKVAFWFHSIDCGDGIITNGVNSQESLQNQLKCMALPNLRGKTVLDIGAWDGFFSFAAEELGAERIVALDHWIWSMDLANLERYGEECRKKNTVPRPYHLIPGIWQPGTLPGKIGFDTIHKIKNSSVEQIVGDFRTIDPLEVGLFDIVFFLGVLYHLEEPFHGLKRASMFTRELAIIETVAIYLENYEHVSLIEFFETDELSGDTSNWFAPNLTGLIKMCKASGFRDVKVSSPYPPAPPETIKEHGGFFRFRLMVHPYK